MLGPNHGCSCRERHLTRGAGSTCDRHEGAPATRRCKVICAAAEDGRTPRRSRRSQDQKRVAQPPKSCEVYPARSPTENGLEPFFGDIRGGSHPLKAGCGRRREGQPPQRARRPCRVSQDGLESAGMLPWRLSDATPIRSSTPMRLFSQLDVSSCDRMPSALCALRLTPPLQCCRPWQPVSSPA